MNIGIRMKRLFRRKPSPIVEQQQSISPKECSPLLSVLVLEALSKKLDFETLLRARGVSQEWNNYISTYILPKRCLLKIIPKSEDKKQWKTRSSKLRKWVPALSVNWEEILVQELETCKVLWKKGIYDFSSISAMTLIESDFRLFDFVNIVMPRMKGLRHLRIADNEFNPITAYHFGRDTFSALYELTTLLKSWAQGIQNLQNLKTFQIGIFCWYSNMIYLRVIHLANPTNLREIYLDLSRIIVYFCRKKLREMHEWLGKLVTLAAGSLEVFKLKYTRRADTDGQILAYNMHLEPFEEFMEGLMAWPNPETLKLKSLKLLFPRASLDHGRVESILLPYLKCLPKLDTLFIGRCCLNLGFEHFHLQWQDTPGLWLSYSMFYNDHDLAQVMRTKYPNPICIELQTVWSHSFELSFIENRHSWSFNGFRERAKRVKSVRAVNSKFNFNFRFFNIPEFLSTFTNLEELELLDNSMPLDHGSRTTYRGAIIGNSHLNHILEAYPRLRSLKLSNCLLLTDSGITGISEEIIKRMEIVGSYNLGKNDKAVVSRLETMKELQFLELRNLTKWVTDISVYLAFKNIPKLEKIAFQGDHRISSWGVKVLNQRFKRNSLFRVYLKQNPAWPTWQTLCDFP